MSTPLIVLASVLAFFAIVLTFFMMDKGSRSQNQDHKQTPGKQGGKSHKKKKNR